ncbi:F-box/FBD/LRR-repeat protein At1g13570-like [Lycium barbarum]|uniref:F-box/FBD/LRR-repeat protein At1g13570-like n=1 Tax=Lycium barbarum TaxID=112863 RepID=UPI00293ED7FB|nr:F-box/FBD/LRR-repeat protein At1g13570-like [Lycium barbarum]
MAEGPITKFTLRVPGSGSCPEIADLIYFLSQNGVQHLVLRLPSKHNPYNLPSSFFTCLQLRHLTLKNCLIIPTPAFKGFDRLISLELCDVKISSKLLECFISHCLLLEQLVLKISGVLIDDIEISAPMLRSFDYTCNIRFVYLKNVPRLANLSLKDGGYFHRAGTFTLAKFFESFFALEHLHLDNDSVKFFAGVGGAVLKRLLFDLNCVRCLYLSDFCLGELEVTLCALFLIRSFPCLQYMEIEVDDGDNNIPALECLEASSRMS